MGTTRFARASVTVAVVAGMAVAATGISGCSWRLESPDPSPPVADINDVVRNDAAVAEARIVDALGVANPSGPGGEWLLAFEIGAAPLHLDALGGVYQPYPEPSEPAPSSSPDSTSAPGPSEYSRAASFARDAALGGALIATDAHLALLLASVGLAHAVALAVQAEQDARANGTDTARVRERVPPPVPGQEEFVLVPGATAVLTATLADLAYAHDHAQYVLEVIAARTHGQDRTDAFTRARIHQDRADALMALAFEADPATVDLRSPSFVTDREALADAVSMRALARDVEADLAALYLGAFDDLAASGAGTPADRAWLVTGAFDALVASVVWSDFAAGSLEPFPGVAVYITGDGPTVQPSPSASPIETISPTPLP